MDLNEVVEWHCDGRQVHTATIMEGDDQGTEWGFIDDESIFDRVNRNDKICR